MSRTSTTAGARRRVPAWTTAAAVVAVLALAFVWRAAPASADTAPAATPTVAPTTASSTTSGSVSASSTSGNIRTLAQGLTSDSQCGASGAPSDTCPLELKLVASSGPLTTIAAGDKWRIGDVIRIDIVIKNTSATPQVINGASAHIDFNADHLQLVKYVASSGSSASDPIAMGSIVSGNVLVPVPMAVSGLGKIIDPSTSDWQSSADASGANSYLGMQRWANNYNVVVSGSGTYTGQIDYEFGTTNSNNFKTIAASASSTIGSLLVRLKSNPDASPSATNYTLTLRDQDAATSGIPDRYRNSVVTGVNSISTNGNLMAQAPDLGLQVAHTEVAMSVVANLPKEFSSSNDRASTRVGDTIAVDLNITAASSMIVRNATQVKASISFPTAQFVLVKADSAADKTSKVAVSAGSQTAAEILELTGFTSDALGSASAGTVTYTESSGTGTVAIDSSATAANAIAMNATSNAVTKTVARIYLRPRYNNGSQDITLGASPEIGIKDASLSRGDGAAACANNCAIPFGITVTGGSATTAVAVTTTTIDLHLSAVTPTGTTPIRVGDVIPVELRVTPRNARHVDHVLASFTFDITQFKLVTNQDDYIPVTTKTACNDASNSTNAPVSLKGRTSQSSTTWTTGTNATVGDSAFGASPTVTCNRYSESGDIGTVELDISGSLLTEVNDSSGTFNSLTSSQPVGTVFLRPRQKNAGTTASFPVTFVTSTGTLLAGEGATPGFKVAVSPTSATDANAKTTIGPVLGTVGVSLKSRTPTVATSSLASNDISWIASSGTLDVVDGRFLDVAIFVDAGATANADPTSEGDALKVDTFSIDVVFDNTQLRLGSSTSLGSTTCNGSGTTARDVTCLPGTSITGSVVVVASGNTSTATFTLLRTNATSTTTAAAAAALLGASTEVARARFQLQRPASPDTAPVSIKVGDTTVLRDDGGVFSTDLYANVRSSVSTDRGELDTKPTINRVKPATLQISTLLQGRTAASASTAFEQIVGVELRTSGSASTRHLTVSTSPESVRQVSSSESPLMQYDRPTVKVALTATATFKGATAAEALGDLEPGTYDVYIKGRSSVAVIVSGVQFNPGFPVTINNLVLREGDIDPTGTSTDKIGAADFTAFAEAYRGQYSWFYGYTSTSLGKIHVTTMGRGKVASGQKLYKADGTTTSKTISYAAGDGDGTCADATASATCYYTLNSPLDSALGTSSAPVLFFTEMDPPGVSDLNQSGAVDILDFSLLASNYNANGPYCATSGCNTGSGYVWAGGSAAEASNTVGVVTSSSTRTNNATASVTVRAGETGSGGVVPVTVGVTPGSRPVDGVQLVLKAAPGASVVSADGASVSSDDAFVVSNGNPLGVAFQQALDAARGMLSMAMGRGPGTANVTSATDLGTVYVKVPAGFVGAPLTIEQVDGPFRTIVAGNGVDLTGSFVVHGIESSTTVDLENDVADEPQGGSVMVSAPGPINAPVSAPAVAPASSAPIASAAPARAAAPASAPASSARP
ncbi:MAG: hypothetical protein KGR25_03950, partial [Chloroflexi bacterium]|nr:hypothetical protein [Chloroflexota bacterium]